MKKKIINTFFRFFYDEIKNKSSLFIFIISLGAFFADVIMRQFQIMLDDYVRLILTMLSLILFIFVLFHSFYKSIIAINNNRALFIVHKSPLVFFEKEIEPIIDEFPFSEIITLDTTPFRDGEHIGWIEGMKSQENVFLTDIKNQLVKFNTLNYISIVEIPFAIHFGYLVSDSISTKYYQRQRYAKPDVNPWKWPRDLCPPSWDVRTKGLSKDFRGKNVLLLIENSYKIDKRDIPFNSITNNEVITVSVNNPSINDLQSEEQVKKLGIEIRKTLDRVATANTIHIFAAVPPPTSFVIGQQINQSAHPECWIYCYKKSKNPPYKFVFKLNPKQDRNVNRKENIE